MTWQAQRTTLHESKTQNGTGKYAKCREKWKAKKTKRAWWVETNWEKMEGAISTTNNWQANSFLLRVFCGLGAVNIFVDSDASKTFMRQLSVFSNYIKFALQRRIKVRTKTNIFRNTAILKQILLQDFAICAFYTNSVHVAISICRSKWMLRILLRQTFLN